MFCCLRSGTRWWLLLGESGDGRRCARRRGVERGEDQERRLGVVPRWRASDKPTAPPGRPLIVSAGHPAKLEPGAASAGRRHCFRGWPAGTGPRQCPIGESGNGVSLAAVSLYL